MDHIYAMLKSNSDDIVLGKVCSDWSKTFANLVGFVGLRRSHRRRIIILIQARIKVFRNIIGTLRLPGVATE